MIEKSQLFDVVPTFISESKEPFKLDGNYIIHFQSLTADVKNFDNLNCNINCDILPNFLKANFV